MLAKIALHANIGQHNVAILYLVLRMVAVNFHIVAVFNEIAFAEDCTANSKSAAWDDTLICKLNSNIFFHGDLRNETFFNNSSVP